MDLNKKVTVLMPVYNGEKYLKEAIESIVNQTYKDFDLLIINDGSSDNSENVILSFSDERIKYIKNDSNMGLIGTLNKGLDLITGEYIARMDQDDISLPKRLEKQVKFMDENEEIAVSGTSIRFFNETGFLTKHIMPINPTEIKISLFFHCTLMHPTVIIRNRCFREKNYMYNMNHKNVEDYGLWQLVSQKDKLGNLQEVLLNYRIVPTGMTQMAEKNVDSRERSHIDIYRQAFEELGILLSEEEYKIYRSFVSLKQGFSVIDNVILDEIMKKIREKLKGQEEKNVFSMYVSKQYLYFLRFYINNASHIKLIIEKSKRINRFNFFSKFWLYQKMDNKIVLWVYKLFLKVTKRGIK